MNYNFDEATKRWNQRATKWDENLNKEKFYTNKENGYERFEVFLEKSFNKNFKNISNIVDLGTGTGRIAHLLKKKYPSSNVIGIDGAEEMLKIGTKNYPNVLFLQDNIINIEKSFIHNSIDLISSRGILISHFGNELSLKLFSIVSSLLNEGGFFIFDCLNSAWNLQTKENLPKQYYSFSEINGMLENANLEIVDIEGIKKRTLNILTKRSHL